MLANQLQRTVIRRRAGQVTARPNDAACRCAPRASDAELQTANSENGLARTIIFGAEASDKEALCQLGGDDLSGKVKLKVEPLPTSLSTQIFPPCSSTNFLAKVNPSPVPSTLCA